MNKLKEKHLPLKSYKKIVSLDIKIFIIEAQNAGFTKKQAKFLKKVYFNF